MEKQKSVIGMAWYRAEDYDTVLGIISDSHQFPDRFDVWLAKAEAFEKDSASHGYVVVRAVIDPKTFPDWCRSRNLNVYAEARMHFANLAAREYVERHNSH